MTQEYYSTLRSLQQLLSIANDVNLTLDRQMEFDEKVKGYVESLIEKIKQEGTVDQ